MTQHRKAVGIMQPTYLPWMGYFELIQRSDVFVFLDDVQFVSKTWQQRNRIKGPQGEAWLTVPVFKRGRRFQPINEVEINNQLGWPSKHLRSIELAYSRSPCLGNILEPLRRIFATPWTKLVELNIALIAEFMGILGIETPTLRSSALDVRGAGNERVLEICKRLGAGELYDTAGASVFIDNGLFDSEGIRVKYQEYHHPIYRQQHGTFVPYLSIVDLLCNEGAESRRIITSGACDVERHGEQQ